MIIIICTHKFIIQNSEELYQDLRQWFNSVCDCDGFNNLHKDQVACVDDTVGNISSKVYADYNNDRTARMLINLAKNSIQRRNPPEVKMSSELIICLSEDCGIPTGSGILPDATFTLYIKNFSCKSVSYVYTFIY